MIILETLFAGTVIKIKALQNGQPVHNECRTTPHAIQEISDSSIFKRKLKTFLSEHAFSIL